MFLLLIFVSSTLFVSLTWTSVSNQCAPKNETCLLPFVTKPCINDGQNLSCTFSLHSNERRKTCDLSSLSLIFTTSHIELFIIAPYYNQLTLDGKYAISKLILEPDITNRTYQYLHWLNIPILAIEIPVDMQRFEIIHETPDLKVTHIVNHLNKEYWHLKIWPTSRAHCRRTIISMRNFTTLGYECPRSNDYIQPRACGYTYNCLDGHPCYFTGYKELVCQTDALRLRMQFEMLGDISKFEMLDDFSQFKLLGEVAQFETIFIVVPGSATNVLHEIQQNTFMINKASSQPAFIAKRIVIIISEGVLQISKNLFNTSDDFEIKIEHANCAEKRFVLDIFDDDTHSVIDNLFDYTTAVTGGVGCHMDKTDATMIDRFKPSVNLDHDTITHAGRLGTISCVLFGLPPFHIEWFRNNTPLNADNWFGAPTTETFYHSFIIELPIGNTTKIDNGIEYRINVANRLGSQSATTRLNVTYAQIFLAPLQNHTVKQGSNVLLKVRIDGNPTPDVYIEWLNFRERLYPTNDDQLLYQYNLQNVQLNQSTSYTFSTLSESYRRNISQTAFLTILDLLYVINRTHTISLEEGDSLELIVHFSHSISKCQWFANETSIEETPINYTYYIKDNHVLFMINNISFEHYGEYQVQAWDVLNQTNQSLTNVHIYSLPPLIIHCYNGTSPTTLRMYIICRFRATNAQIQWFDTKNRAILNQSHYESVNDSIHIFEAKLVFNKIKHQHFGIYTFQVNNSGGSVKHKINFTGQDMSPIIIHHSFHSGRIYKHQGDSYSFSLHFNAVPWPNVTFFFNNKILLSYADPNVSLVSVLFKSLTINNEGIYYARVMNSEGFVETYRTELCILQAPSFLNQNQQLSSVVSVKPNQTITLITPPIKSGSPDPLTIIWFVKENTFKQVFNSSVAHAQLTIDPSLQQEHVTCVVQNKYGENVYSIRLHFLQAPQCLLPLPKRMYVELGQSVTLTVNVTGNPFPTIQWFYNKHVLDHKQVEYHLANDDGLYSLMIRNFTWSYVGNYSVIVNNSEDTISSETQITLKSIISQFNTIPSIRPITLTTTIVCTVKLTSTSGENLIRIMLLVLMSILWLLLIIPCFCTKERLLAWFVRRKEDNDGNDLPSNQDETDRSMLSPQ